MGIGDYGPRWWSKDTIAVVTGSNQGIGYGVVKELAKQGITVVLTARNEQRGLDAQKSLISEGLDNVLFHQLDISQPESISEFESWLKQTCGGLDILVNNAAIAHSDALRNYQVAKECLDVNYYGTKRIIEALLPLLKPSAAGARIVNVSSRHGVLEALTDESLKKQCAALNTEDEIDALVQKFLTDVHEIEDGRIEKRGWAIEYSYYQCSKLCLNAYTRCLASKLADRPEGHRIYVNSLCPGLTRTSLTLLDEKQLRGRDIQSMEEGVDTPVWLALHPAGGPSGLFFQKRKPTEF